ncbi:hypothetical protein EYS14_00115 [Alteromonadaceae bacterium M269]|nr:hypothetical protein EYS14_00115 [Alteromonadaceae bacterium M269]
MDDNTYREHYTLEQKYDSESGKLLCEKFRNSAGQLDRGGLPSELHYYRNNGELREIKYHRNGVLHREDGPAQISFHEDNGTIGLEYWYKNGKQHRDGTLPAVIGRQRDGRIWTRSYWKNGEKVAPTLEGLTVNKFINDLE